MWRFGMVGVFLLLATACSDELTLVVDLKTDFVPGAEFIAVRTVVDGVLVAERSATLRDDFLSGGRVAETSGLDAGSRDVTVSLIDAAGDVIATRQVRVQQDSTFGITVLITRDCAAVSCPAAGDPDNATACVAGACVDPGCNERNTELCPDPECVNASDCPMAESCARAICDEGACLYAPVPGACAGGEFCVVERGCESLPGVDAGAPRDAGDGGRDAGPMDPDAGAGGLVVTSVSTGGAHTCARLEPSGEVACWGDNTSRQAGQSFGPQFLGPTSTSFGVVEDVTAYFNSSCLRRSGGALECWGRGEAFELGVDINPLEFSDTPQSITAIPAMDFLIDGMQPCAISPGRQLFCWGFNASGQLGIGTRTPGGGELPGTSALQDTIRAATGGNHACGLTILGEIYCWGRNTRGELGIGAAGDRTSPVLAMVATDVTWQLALGEEHTCVVNAARELWCWGDNTDSQQAAVSPDMIDTPTLVPGIAADGVCAGAYHTCVRMGGAVSCVGTNDRGQLGRGTTTPFESTFVAVVGLTDAASLHCGKHHTCARRATGRVACWGDGTQGQLGDGMGTSSATPVTVIDL